MSGFRRASWSLMILVAWISLFFSCPAMPVKEAVGILCGGCRAVAEGFYQLCGNCGQAMDERIPTGERSEIDYMVLPGRLDPELVRRLTSYSRLMARSRELREALRRNPHDWDKLNELAEVSRELDWYAMEAAVLERVSIEFPERFDAGLKSRLAARYFYWARVLMHSRENEKAAEIMALAREKGAKGSEFDYWNGKLLVALGKYTEARPYLEKALDDPKLVNSAYYLLRMAKGSKKYGSDLKTGGID